MPTNVNFRANIWAMKTVIFLTFVKIHIYLLHFLEFINPFTDLDKSTHDTPVIYNNLLLTLTKVHMLHL
jgi:hypothetical protein